MLQLKPHHVGAYINFYKKRKDLLDETEYLNAFKIKNSGYHNDEFITNWRIFLINLGNNPGTTFIYSFEYDNVCKTCDIIKECKNTRSELHKLVNRLDLKYHQELKLIPGKEYSINYINNNFL